MRRSRSDVLGLYREGRRLRLGRSPFINQDEWRRVKTNRGPLRRLGERIGILYGPDRTRRTPSGRHSSH